MSFFLNLPIGKKLLLAFGLMATLMLILGLFAIYELEKVNYSSTVIVEEHLPRLVAAAKIDVKTSDYRRRQLRMLEQHTQEENRKYAERLQQDESAMADELERLATLVKDPDDQASIAELTSNWKNTKPSNNRSRRLTSRATKHRPASYSTATVTSYSWPSRSRSNSLSTLTSRMPRRPAAKGIASTPRHNSLSGS